MPCTVQTYTDTDTHAEKYYDIINKFDSIFLFNISRYLNSRQTEIVKISNRNFHPKNKPYNIFLIPWQYCLGAFRCG